MENENSTKYIICSKCFKDTGLQKEAEQLGVKKQLPCPICGKIDGAKLDKNELEEVCNRFFLKGSFYRTLFGGSRNLNVYFENSKQDDMICTSSGDWIGRYESFKREIWNRYWLVWTSNVESRF
jgi:hypothetical protein